MKLETVDTLILGGGISGLVLAYAIKDALLFEKTPRVGGLIQTITKDGYQFEIGPNSIRTNESVLSLAEELHLKDEILIPPKSTKYILHNGRLESLSLLSPLLKGLRLTLLKGLFFKNSIHETDSVLDYFSRRFSPEVVERLIDPIVTGIYAGDPASLSMSCAFPDRRKPKIPFFSFRNGMETLTKALQNKVQDRLFLNEEAEALSYDKGWRVRFKSGKTIHAKTLISALPLPALNKLLPEVPMIPHASLAVVSIAYEPVAHKKGFGYLVPHKEKSPLLGAIFNSSIFPRDEPLMRLSAMLGGVRNPDILKKSDAEIIDITIKELSKHLETPLKPRITLVHARENAIPQYPVGYTKTCNLPHFFAAGNAFSGVSIGDLVKNAFAIAKQITNK